MAAFPEDDKRHPELVGCASPIDMMLEPITGSNSR